MKTPKIGAAMGQCAHCGEWNITRLSYCARCGTELPWASLYEKKAEAPDEAINFSEYSWFEGKLRQWGLLTNRTVMCRFCESRIAVEETVCPNCKQNLVVPGKERWR